MAEATFEESMERLEAILRRLESGEAPLDESLHLFEEGVGIVKHCRTVLETAQQRVQALLEEEGLANMLEEEP